MIRSKEQSGMPQAGVWIQEGLFHLGCFFYLLFRVHPVLILEMQPTVFFKGDRPYFSHIDSLGNASKAFIMPQEDPWFYGTCLDICNVPEFIKEPARISPQTLAKAAFANALSAKLDPDVIPSKSAEVAKSARGQEPQK